MESLLNILKSIDSRVTLIAVSKKKSNQLILEAYNCGQRNFGENYVQELATKAEGLPKDINWHMIGHLQSNKVKYIAPFVHLVHSVDSAKLLKEINKQALKNERVINCLLQIHIAQEESKTGFDAEELKAFILGEEIKELKGVKVIGLMGMASFTNDESVLIDEFDSVKSIFEELKAGELPPNVALNEISMGMSGDWELAIEHGSTMVRIGSSIFGNRN